MLCLLMCVSLFPMVALADGDRYLEINETNFPDANFRQYVIDSLAGGKDYMTKAEVENVGHIRVTGKGIANLKGIEHFSTLKTLHCQNNQLTALDVSKNTALEDMDCSSNLLAALDVGKNTALKSLYCDNNLLTALDVNGCTALGILSCYDNQLTALDASGCTTLGSLSCSQNQLTALDVSGWTALVSLSCNNNQLTTLDVSSCTALETLSCYNNQLIALDVSGCTVLRKLSCNNNQLMVLNVSRNTTLKLLDCYDNQLTLLDMSGCIALGTLYCSNNQLTALDVSHNTALKLLVCFNNQLMALDVSKNTALGYLDCSNNLLTALDVSKNRSLSELYCSGNQLPMLELSANGMLVDMCMWQKVKGQTLNKVNGKHECDLSRLIPLSCMNNVTVTGDDKLDKTTGKVTFAKKVNSFTYQYTTGHGAMDVTVLFEKGDDPITPPTIKTQPKNANVKSGSKAKFTVKVKEKGVTYQWFSKAPGAADWTAMAGENKATLTVVGTKANSGTQYRCRVRTTEGGEACTIAATLTVKIQPPAVKTQPKDLTAKSGKKVKFSVKASGKGLTYTWFSRPNAEAAWTPVAGQTKSSLSVVASKANDGSQYYCHIQNADGEVDSAVVTLTVTPEAPTVKTQPKDAKVKLGAKAKFKVKATGKNVTYQWYYRTSETGEWILMEGQTFANLTVIATEANIGWQFRCRSWNADGEAYSNPATLRLK